MGRRVSAYHTVLAIGINAATRNGWRVPETLDQAAQSGE
jgi:hypothetical protein